MSTQPVARRTPREHSLHLYPYTQTDILHFSTGDYCVSSTLSSIQNSTGTNITTSFLIDLLSGQNLDSVESSFTSGSLCTGCVQQIYAQAVQANATIAQSSIASGLSSQCGSSFTSSECGMTCLFAFPLIKL